MLRNNPGTTKAQAFHELKTPVSLSTGKQVLHRHYIKVLTKKEAPAPKSTPSSLIEIYGQIRLWWTMLKRKVRERKPINLNELYQLWQEQRSNIQPKTC